MPQKPTQICEERGTTSRPRMPPLIRRQSLWERVSSYPHDLLLSLNETYELLEWDSVSDTLSIPLGVGLNGLYILARRDQQQQASSYYEKDVFEGSRVSRSRDGGGIFTGANGSLHTFLYVVSWCLVGFSIMNALFCFTKRKNYRMFDAKPNRDPVTPGARRVTIDSPVTYSPGFFSSMMYQILHPDSIDKRQNFRPSTPQFAEDGGKKQAWELSIWDPSTFSLNTFRWFSPLHVLIIDYLGPVSIFETLCLLTLSTIQLSLLITFSTSQQKNKTALYTQVFSEYNTKFIEPRINVTKRDVGTSTPTSSADVTPSADTGTVDYAASTYGATGASVEAFRRKYGPVRHTPLRKSHSVTVGPDFTPAPAMKRPPTGTGTSAFDLWNKGGSDFPSPIKVPKVRENPAKTSKSASTPAFPRPVSRGPTFVNNSPIKFGGRKRYSAGDEDDDGIPGVRKW